MIKRMGVAESLVNLGIQRANVNDKSSSRVFSLKCSIWPLAMPHFSDNYSVNHPVSHHHKKTSVIMETHQAPRTGKHWESGKAPN